MRSIIFLVFFICSISLSSQILKGKIVEVLEGDILIFEDLDSTEYTIKLANIECPRKDNDYRVKATQYTASLCYNKDARIKVVSKYDNDSIVGIAFVNGKNINEFLLLEGLAWRTRYKNKTEYLARLEEKASRRNLNIWSRRMHPAFYEIERPHISPENKTIPHHIWVCGLTPTIYHFSSRCITFNNCSVEILQLDYSKRFDPHRRVCTTCSKIKNITPQNSVYLF
ncbi:MAG: thermonuclease family protein [Dysgonomonas sp.]|nr:thermonuclease family protein [Dysgonomonas sp.]